jgi:hypothetical protein
MLPVRYELDFYIPEDAILHSPYDSLNEQRSDYFLK